MSNNAVVHPRYWSVAELFDAPGAIIRNARAATDAAKRLPGGRAKAAAADADVLLHHAITVLVERDVFWNLRRAVIRGMAVSALPAYERKCYRAVGRKWRDVQAAPIRIVEFKWPNGTPGWGYAIAGPRTQAEIAKGVANVVFVPERTLRRKRDG